MSCRVRLLAAAKQKKEQQRKELDKPRSWSRVSDKPHGTPMIAALA